MKKMIVIAQWFLALLLIAVVLGLLKFQSQDPDSFLYANMSAEASILPCPQCFVPMWTNWSGVHTFFKESPPGLFVLPIMLAKMGYPAQQAAYAINSFYQILTLLFLYLFCLLFFERTTAITITCLSLFSFISLQYTVRANHEQGVYLGLVISFYLMARALLGSINWLYLLFFILAFVLYVKGVVVLLPVSILFWVLVLSYWLKIIDRQKFLKITLTLGLVFLLLLASLIIFDKWYFLHTKQYFWSDYYRIQVSGRAFAHQSFYPWYQQKPYNFFWYALRGVFYALPFTVFIGLALKKYWGKQRLKGFFLLEKSQQLFYIFIIGTIFSYYIAFSFSDRKADRYVFPATQMLSILGIVILLKFYPKITQKMERTFRLNGEIIPLVWFLVTFLGIIIRLLPWQHMRFWPSEIY